MKIGICWISNNQIEIEKYIEKVNTDIVNKNLSNNIFLFSFFENKFTQKLNYKINVTSKKEFLHYTFESILDEPIISNIDLLFISFGNSFPLNVETFYNYIIKTHNNNFLISTRIFKIRIISERFPARFPFLDDHFIVLNMKNKILIKDKISKKYYVHLGENNSYNIHLLSFIEACFNKNDLILINNEVKNVYSNNISYDPINFSFCEQSSIITHYNLTSKKKEQKFINLNFGKKYIIFNKMNFLLKLFIFIEMLIKKIFSINKFGFQKKY